jgi:hypothetical protein
VKITYYLDDKSEENLYCRISDGTVSESFPLEYTIVDEEWDAEGEEGYPDDPYYYTLIRFREYLSERYEILSDRGIDSILSKIKEEVAVLTEESGIQGIARKMFDDENAATGMATYDQFLLAFETHAGLDRDEYEARVIDNTLEFITEDEDEYQMDTYAGLTARLKSFVEKKSCAEIASMTNKLIWSEIYTEEGGIEKYVFLPAMLAEWENFWDNAYDEINNTEGETDHLDKLKEKSWRQFQVLMACYDAAGDIVQLAAEIEDTQLYPIAVLTMLEIFDADVCYEKYCKSELEDTDWESVEVDGMVFFVKEGEY